MVIACSLRIKLYQKDVKSAFLNEILNKEVYVEQPKGFEDPKFPSHVYRLGPLMGLINNIYNLYHHALG